MTIGSFGPQRQRLRYQNRKPIRRDAGGDLTALLPSSNLDISPAVE
jgi:hypothetical protein